MLNLHIAALSIALALLAAGCSSNSSITNARLMSVEVGMPQNELLTIMGQPQRRETYGSTEFLIYSKDGGGNTALLNFTPIAVVDGRVTGIGRNIYDTVVRSKTQADLADNQSR